MALITLGNILGRHAAQQYGRLHSRIFIMDGIGTLMYTKKDVQVITSTGNYSMNRL
jgi:hypothetical protein